jgi:hypothetical protein
MLSDYLNPPGVEPNKLYEEVIKQMNAKMKPDMEGELLEENKNIMACVYHIDLY